MSVGSLLGCRVGSMLTRLMLEREVGSIMTRSTLGWRVDGRQVG